MSVDENLWRNWSSQSIKITRFTGSLALGRPSGCSATLFSYCMWMKITSEAKSPIYRKSSMGYRVTYHLRLLRQFKCLTALKNLQHVWKLYQYDAPNLLSCMILDMKNIHLVVHHKDKLFAVLHYPRNFGNAAKEGLKRTTHWAA